MAVVSMRPDQRADEEDLTKYCQGLVADGKIAKFWVPDRFIFMTEPLPKTSTGKLDKKILREKYSAILGN